MANNDERDDERGAAGQTVERLKQELLERRWEINDMSSRQIHSFFLYLVLISISAWLSLLHGEVWFFTVLLIGSLLFVLGLTNFFIHSSGQFLREHQSEWEERRAKNPHKNWFVPVCGIGALLPLGMLLVVGENEILRNFGVFHFRWTCAVVLLGIAMLVLSAPLARK